MTTRTCSEPSCTLPAAPRSPRCGWHRLARASRLEQEAAATRRAAAARRQPGFQERRRMPRAEVPAGLSWCSDCQWLVPDWYGAPGGRCKAHARMFARKGHVLRTYGLSADEHAALLALQGGRCAICNQRPQSRAMPVDHDHDTGQVRGLLCTRCNHDLLGAAHDRVEILRAAVHYLEHPPASGDWDPQARPTAPGVVLTEDPGDPPF